MTERIDLRADLHGHALDYARTQDRAWFERHPDAVKYHRPAVPHEWCRSTPTGCASLLELPEPLDGHRWEIHVEVERIAVGLRRKRPYAVLVQVEAVA
jgi:hypothetical protein